MIYCSGCGGTRQDGMILVTIDERFISAKAGKPEQYWICEVCVSAVRKACDKTRRSDMPEVY
jgi:hypothetical protein